MAEIADKKKQEEVIVIGGGLGGCLSALFALRAGYKVTLLEEKDKLLDGATLYASRLHLGGEYPLDAKTGEDCLKGAVAWKLIMPSTIYNHGSEARFLISKKTETEGKKIERKNRRALLFPKGMGKVNETYLTVDKYVAYYENIRKKYEELLGQVRSLTGWEQEEAEKALFGPATVGSFYEKITPLTHKHEFAGYENSASSSLSPSSLDRQPMAGGVKSREPGLNIAVYLALIEQILHYEVQRGRLHIHCQSKAEAISQTADGRWSVACEGGRRFEADQVVQAAFEQGIALDMPHRADPSKKVTAYRRAMAIVDTSEIPMTDLPHSTFTMLGRNGGMYCPWNKNLAILYHPGAAYLGETVLDKDHPHVPKEWAEPLSPKQAEALKKSFKENLAGIYPFLRKARFVDVIVRNTLNFQDTLSARRHEPTEEIKPGYFAMYPTKLTLAPLAAVEVVEGLKARSAAREGKEVPARDVLEAILQPENAALYRIEPSMAPAKDFAMRRGASPTMVATGLYAAPQRAILPTETAPAATDVSTGTMTVKTRSFGQGFGPHKVAVYTETGPKTGDLFADLSDCERIRAWAEAGAAVPVTQAVPAERLTRAVHNQLLHADMLDLVEMVPALITELSARHRSTLFSASNLGHIPAETWETINASRAHALPSLQPNALHEYFLCMVPGSLSELAAAPGSPEQVRRREATEIAAAVLPMLFAALPEPERAAVTAHIAEWMSAQGPEKNRKFFAPLADPNLNKLVIRRTGATMYTEKIFNNGRTLQVVPGQHVQHRTPPYTIQFQGKEFRPVQFHFHRNKNIDREGLPRLPVKDKAGRDDGRLEFKLYRHQGHQTACQSRLSKDPNDDIAGELHAIFMHQEPESADQKPGHKTALALCAHVQARGRDWRNRVLDHYVEPLRGVNEPLAEGSGVRPAQTLPFEPLECFTSGAYKHKAEPFGKDEKLPEAPFASLFLGGIAVDPSGKAVLREDASDIFYRGVHAVHLPKPISISLDQMRILENAQGPLAVLPDDMAVKPIARAGRG